MSQPSQQYFVAGLDPTGFTSITAAQLLSLVNGATPQADKGVIIVTVAAAPTTLFPNGVPNVPAANGTVEWQNCIWLSVFNTFVTAYVWNPNGATDPTYLNWITLSQASIGAGSIQGYQIAAGTITSANISSVSSSSITGSVVAGWLAQLNIPQTAYATNGLINNNSPVFGDLAGVGSTVALPVIAPLAVTTGKIALQAVSGNATAGQSQIKDNSIVSQQIKINGALATIPLSAGATGGIDPQTNITVPSRSIVGLPTTINFNPLGGTVVLCGDPLVVNYDSTGAIDGFVTNRRAILTLPDPDAANADTGKIPVVVNHAYSLATPASLVISKVVQTIIKTAASPDSTSTAIPQDATIPQITEGKEYVTVAITPTSATNLLHIRFSCFVSNGTNAGHCAIALFQDSTANALQATSSQFVLGGGTDVNCLTIDFWMTAGTTSATTFRIRFGPGANTGYINQASATALFGAAANSYLSVEELIGTLS